MNLLKERAKRSLGRCVNLLKKTLIGKGGLTEICFAVYFGPSEVDRIVEFGLGEVGRLGERYLRKVGGSRKLGLMKVSPPGKMSTLETYWICEFSLGKRDRTREKHAPEIKILTCQLVFESLIEKILILFRLQGMKDAQIIRISVPGWIFTIPPLPRNTSSNFYRPT